jgi:hypothetical protein
MKSHNGMRPQDIVILLKILVYPKPDWQYRDLALSLYLSISEISESLSRSHIAGLVDESKRRVHRQSLMEFLEHGLHYVFPQVPGTYVTGVPTAHSQAYFKARFQAELEYAWADDDGEIRGLSITPLYRGVPKAVKQDDTLHQLLAATDIIRVGRMRELQEALILLKQVIKP